MLRITVHIDEKAVTLQMEGRFVGEAIPEAEGCWQATRAEHPDRPLRIDLRAVTFMDQEGKLFLKHIFQQGASFLSSGCMTRAYVEEITKSAENPPRERHEERSVP